MGNTFSRLDSEHIGERQLLVKVFARLVLVERDGFRVEPPEMAPPLHREECISKERRQRRKREE